MAHVSGLSHNPGTNTKRLISNEWIISESINNSKMFIKIEFVFNPILILVLDLFELITFKFAVIVSLVGRTHCLSILCALWAGVLIFGRRGWGTLVNRSGLVIYLLCFKNPRG